MKKSVGVSLAAVLIAAGLVFFKWCAPPPPPNDFGRAGNDGGRIPPGAPTRETTITVNPRGNSFSDAALTTLACGTPYKLLASATERVENCATANYTRVRDLAQASLANRYVKLDCPITCGPKLGYMTFVEFTCSGRRATANVKQTVICPNVGSETNAVGVPLATTPVIASTRTAAPGEDGSMAPPDRRGELITELTVGATASLLMTCGEKQTFAYTYSENEPGGCASFANYTPYVVRAETRARQLHYDGAFCPSNCTKQPFTIQRREWSCDANTSNVVVKLWYSVECK